MTEKGLPALQYLDHPNYGPASHSLRFSLDIYEKSESPRDKAIQAALIPKSSLQNTLLEGEYEVLVGILASEYPLSFKVWLDGVINSLNHLLLNSQSITDENIFPIAIQPYFQSRLNETKKNISFIWTPNP